MSFSDTISLLYDSVLPERKPVTAQIRHNLRAEHLQETTSPQKIPGNEQHPPFQRACMHTLQSERRVDAYARGRQDFQNCPQ